MNVLKILLGSLFFYDWGLLPFPNLNIIDNSNIHLMPSLKLFLDFLFLPLTTMALIRFSKKTTWAFPQMKWELMSRNILTLERRSWIPYCEPSLYYWLEALTKCPNYEYCLVFSTSQKRKTTQKVPGASWWGGHYENCGMDVVGLKQ
jgi:hypothetical protein